MRARALILVLTLQLAAAPAFAQQGEGFQRWPSRGGDGGRTPAPQGQGQGQGQGGGPTVRDRGAQPRTAPPAGPTRQRGDNGGRQGDQNRGGNRNQGDRGRVDRGRNDANPRVAVPRQGQPPVVRRGRPGSPGSNVYIVRPPAYRYVPRFNRPYAFGALGPGYFYYGAFGWYPRATYLTDLGYFGRGYGFDLGEVRLRVQPRWAEVYVDGFYAGTVDDFDGIFQSLRLESGPYHIEIVAPGYETLEVDLRITPGEKITYRGDMRPEF